MVKILDTTVRDGSYVIDFQFSSSETTAIAARLDDAGCHYIEIGHGLGLGAGKKKGMISAESDLSYLNAGRIAVSKNKWGMFFIPGIGTLEDIDMAAKCGMNFIRIGTNVTEIEQSKTYIERAKKLGMEVFANYMKTYAVSPNEVAKSAQLSKNYGADVVCVVDSAGGMMPEEVRQYVSAVKDACDVMVGYHGHNNLGLAIANSLIAAECGADIIDTSVRGMGRSAGNTVTEIFLYTLKRRGIETGIDVMKILNLAEKIIDPLMLNYKQVDSIGIISGFAQFHSSFQAKVFEYSKKYNIDPRELIIELTKVDTINAPDKLLEELSVMLANDKKKNTELTITPEKISNYTAENKSIDQKINELVIQVNSLAKKRGKTSVFNISQTYNKSNLIYVSSSIHENENYVLASCEFKKEVDAVNAARILDGKIECILLDTDIKSEESKEWINTLYRSFTKSEVIPYSDIQAWAESITQLVLNLNHGSLSDKKVLLVGKNFLSGCISPHLNLFGASIVYCDCNTAIASADYDIIVFCDQFSGRLLKIENKEIVLIDGLIGAIPNEQIEKVLEKGINIYRPDMIAVILSKLQSTGENMKLINEKQGYGNINGVKIAAGGLVAPKGTVIVDSITNPSKIFGIANGMGYLISTEQYSEEDLDSKRKIENWILTQTLN